jgi:hypothetical protein
MRTAERVPCEPERVPKGCHANREASFLFPKCHVIRGSPGPRRIPFKGAEADSALAVGLSSSGLPLKNACLGEILVLPYSDDGALLLRLGEPPGERGFLAFDV